ncbi:MAG TPA: hypothetical protein VGR47_08090 [Terracidiphilus sp.]|nr:hypothetical protein [Terracidiphilus sp.]
MKVTIQGTDYTAALDAANPLTIERKLNEPSACHLYLALPPDGSLAAPSRNQYITVTGDDDTVYFTGYILVTPLLLYAGTGMQGPQYYTSIQAVSDEILLDQALMLPGMGQSGETAGALLTRLVTRTGSTKISTQDLTLSTTIGTFVPEPGAVWSKNAGQIAMMARGAYRAVNGALALTSLQSALHRLNESDGSLDLACLALTATTGRAPVNDVTVCGEIEPVAYVTEYFQGDGVTAQFYLAADPYLPSSSKGSIIHELFSESQIDLRSWGLTGSSGYFTLGASGLAMNGGNGIDGQCQLCWLDPVEISGTLLLEAVGVTLSPGSCGILAALYSGMRIASNCFAGFQATAQQGTGAVTLQPFVNGAPAGTSFTTSAANQYTLRIRVHCPEHERTRANYRSFGDNGQISAGGDVILSPGMVQIELQEFVNGVGAVPVTLYDGSVSNLPATCTIAAASSLNLVGSMRALNMVGLGSGWVISAPSGAGAFTRRLGSTAEAGECQLGRGGSLLFYPGYTPAVGEQIAVSYRTNGRAVGRAVNATSQQALQQAGSPPVSAWTGTVTNPPARSSTDCRNAALVIGLAAAGVTALWSGLYKGTRGSFATDIWPGDALALDASSMNLDTQVIVRSVKITYTASYPDLIEYSIQFANDWADDLAIQTSKTVPADAWLPAPVSPTLLPNLNSLTVTGLNGSTVSIDAGITPPEGGGFEIRRRDFAFMPGEDPDLVTRGTQANMTFARESAHDRFYVRAFDAATPPNYSEFSAALFINLPLGS